MKKLLQSSKLLLFILIIQTAGVDFYSQSKDQQVQKTEKDTKINRAKDIAFKQRLSNGGINLKGDITFVANSIVSKHQDGTRANDDYNGYDGNGLINMEYIDIDSDPKTFSSSKSALDLPGCSKVVFAGLYWAAVYPRKHWTINYGARDTDFNEIKFKLPGGEYLDITGDIVYDDGEDESKPYMCYSDVTSLVSSLGDPNGDYYAANIKATVGRDDRGRLGSSGGWIMVVIYENELEPSRRISIFDGFSSVGGGTEVDISYSGFTTIPNGPVKAKMLVAALEGDRAIQGDQFKMKDIYGVYRNFSTPYLNPEYNFFNGSITLNDAFLNGREPSSENTLGFDADLFSINNVNNRLISNGQTEAAIKFKSTQDVYWAFLNAMSIDIIEPDIELIKTIDDGNNNDISGGDVDLGGLIWYNISFRNKGNDNALGTELIDRLPKNVDLVESDIVVPPGVTYTYEPPVSANEFRGVLRFTIPDDLVEIGDPLYNIRLKVQVVKNCNDLRDVCSNRIENQVIASYRGEKSRIIINEDPSFYGVNTCNVGLVGPSNFLADVSGCSYERDEVLCSADITLTAGNGFISYEWKNEAGDVIGNSQSVTVLNTGTYTVNKIAPVGCISTSEIVNVVSFNAQENPLLAYADKIKTCPNDGSKLTEIYLCGDGSIKEIETSIDNSDAIIWQKLDENSCGAVVGEDCANVDNSCTWNTEKTGNDFTAKEPGQYRLEIRYQGRCFKRFYFNVFKATLTPQIVTKDIICGTPGSITVNNIPDNYEFSLTNSVGSFQDDNLFNIGALGSYSLFIRKKGGSATSCVYTVNNIDILEKNIDVKLITEPILCSDSKGEIRVQVDNIPGDYTYKLTKDGAALGNTGPIADNDHSFEVSEEGEYTVEVTAPNSCVFVGNVTFTKPTPLDFSAVVVKDVNCSDGIIELNTSGGTPLYNYAIWSHNGLDFYSSPNDIPIDAFFTGNSYDVKEDKIGTFEFLVMDANNCWVISNEVTIGKEPDLIFKEDIKNNSCFEGSNGSISLSVDGSLQGYTLEYSIDNGVSYKPSGSFNNLESGDYTIKINASKGLDVCTYEKNITVTEPDKLKGAASLTKEYTCEGFGEISFDTPSGGTAPYKFSIDGSNYVSQKTFSGLSEGTYSLAIKDANKCVLKLQDIELKPLPITPVFTSDITYNCSGEGTITVLPLDTFYTYSINGGAATNNNVFDKLPSDTYTIAVNYGSKCVETFTAVVKPNKAFAGEVLSTRNVKCNLGSDGEIKLSVENFNASFEYSLNGGSWIPATSSPVTISGLDARDYSIQIKSDSCILDLGTKTISEPTKITVAATVTTNLSCKGADAIITPTASGGTPPYEFSIDNGATWLNKFSNLDAGTYTIQAKDASSCVAATTATIKIEPTSALEYTTTSTQCYDGSNGEIEVTVTKGNENYLFSINNGPWQLPESTTSNTYTFKNLLPNSYTIKVKDKLDCEVTTSNHVILPQLNATVLTNDVNCIDGNITVNATGGDGNYVYAFVVKGTTVTATNFGNTNTKAITAAGDFDVYVRDKAGLGDYCEFVKTVTISKTPDLGVVATSTDPKCFGEKGKIEVAISGGLAPYKIEISNTSGYSETINNYFNTTRDFINLLGGDYTVKITGSDSCIETTTATIVTPIALEAVISPILPPGCEADSSNFGFEFVVTNSYAPYTLQYSKDNGVNWLPSPIFMDIPSGTEVFPAIRIVEADGTTLRCEKLLDSYTIPYPVSNLVVSADAGGTCADGFSVIVEAKDGFGPYQFAINSDTNWQTPSPSNSDQFTFTNLTPGLSYVFYVKDATGCIKQNSVDVYDSYTPDIKVTGNVTKDACFTSDTGEVSFSIDDSLKPLTGQIDWELFDAVTVTSIKSGNQLDTSDITVSNLASGDYYMVITQGASCSWGSKTISIKRGAEIVGTVSNSRDITCALPGLVEISTIKGGFGGYEFTLSSPNFKADIVSSNLFIEVPLANIDILTDPIVITVNVTDASGCAKDLGTVDMLVSESPEIASVKANSCDTDKTIEVSGDKGLTPYYYSIDGGATYQTLSLFNNLPADDYTVKIKDSNGCESGTQIVTIVPTLVFEATITKNLDCSPSPNAEVVINVKNGSGDYDFEVKNSSGPGSISKGKLTTNPQTISLQNAGEYEIIVYDNNASDALGNSCPKTIPVKILEVASPTFSYTVTDSSCSGSNSGTIALTNLNKSVDYTYSINPVSGTFDIPSNSFINVKPGDYTIKAVGSNECSTNQTTIKVNEFDAIVVPTPTVTEFLCAKENTNENASISIDTSSITGGSGSYTIFEFIDNKGTPEITDDIIVQRGKEAIYFSNNKNGGNYTINVYDASGCIGTTNASIKPFAEISSVAVTVDKKLDCATGEKLTITYTSTLPIPNVSYTITGIKGFTDTNNTGVFTDLPEDTYTASVTNLTTGCSLETSHIVKEVAKFQLEVNTLNDVSCFGSKTGKISFNFSASTPYSGAYSYVLYNSVSGNATLLSGTSSGGVTVVNALEAGEYYAQIKMTDTPFCDVKSEVFSIENPVSVLDFTITKKEIDCNTATSGAILINATGGWGEYQYKVTTSSGSIVKDFNANNSIENLPAATYNVIVKDKNGCEVTKSIALKNPTPIAATWSETQSIVCNGGLGAEITVDVASGGQGNPPNYWYQIQKNGESISVKQSSNIFKNLSSGAYTVTVSDDFSCTLTLPVSISQPTKVVTKVAVTNSISCLVTLTSVEVSAAGGSGGYTYSSDGINFVSSNVFNVGPGNHQFYAKDKNDCVSEASATINTQAVTPLSAVLNVEASLISCATEENAIISAIASGGLGNYKFELLNSTDVVLRPKQTSNIFDNLGAGTYKIKVTSEDCEFTTLPTTIVEPKLLELTAPTEVENVTCFEGKNGTITINAKGGTGNLIYSIDEVKYVNTNKFTNLSAGTYNVIVQDESGCFIMETVIIKEPLALVASVINVTEETCFEDDDGSFSIKIEGGTAPYKTKLNNGVFVEGKLDFTNLLGGKTYTVFVEDTSGCETSVTVTLQKGVDLNLTTDTTLNCKNYLTTISASVAPSLASNVLYSLDGGTAQASGEFKDLATGIYKLTVLHTNGCKIEKDINIDNPDPLLFDGPIQVVNNLCYGESDGSITMNAKGGRGDYLYSIDGINYKTTNVFSNLLAGTYTVFVKDDLGCEPIKETVIIKEPLELIVTPKNIVEVTCSTDSNGSFELDISGDEAPYFTKLDEGTFVENQFSFSNLEGGKTYKVVVKGKNGCEKTVAVTLQPSINLILSPNLVYTCADGATISSRIVNSEYQNEITYTINGLNPQSHGVYKHLAPGTYEIKATHVKGCFVTSEIIVEDIGTLELVIDTATKNTLIADSYGGTPPYTFSLNGGEFDTNNVFLIHVTEEYTITVKDARGCEVSTKVKGNFIPIMIPNFFTPNNNNENDYWYPEEVESYHNLRVSIYDRYSRLLKEFTGIQQGWDGIYNGKPMPTGDYWAIIYYTDSLGAEQKIIRNFTLYR
ncbi:hypothetical protein CW731_09515 [Polaribacter sp. ALD11]|uniref:T9SS type B sorting domain-containing protein n=1 Tax=Polaribacter sp. ALD11 TaxID=2058137 RepID=UPI000C3073E5|nr:T9SS type B sorting domain-containing protein [Polaribacter sp. ALD11]AUC85513.1 hypothetical protein CW731_09515 [Polaribacter sp. ALD11]